MAYDFRLKSLAPYVDQLLDGALTTVQLSASAMAIGLTIGILCALLKAQGPRQIQWVVNGYVEIIRNTPLLVQCFFVFFGLGWRDASATTVMAVVDINSTSLEMAADLSRPPPRNGGFGTFFSVTGTTASFKAAVTTRARGDDSRLKPTPHLVDPPWSGCRFAPIRLRRSGAAHLPNGFRIGRWRKTTRINNHDVSAPLAQPSIARLARRCAFPQRRTPRQKRRLKTL